MHILLVNDDGPPSPHSSPYVHTLVRELQAAGHVVSVCLPHTQRSWIGKAHMIGQTVKPTYYRPPPPPLPPAGLRLPAPGPDGDGDAGPAPDGTTHARPARDPAVEEWVLVDGTPASCVQIGLYHLFAARGPVDLVLSGPNYGRNTTAVFALSSGTLGGALEAAICRRRAVALSYAFLSRDHDAAVVAAASRHAVRVVEALARAWPADGSVDVYSVNVPLVADVAARPTLWTPMLQNYWDEGSCFAEVDGSVDGADEDEERIRGAEPGGEPAAEADGRPAALEHKHFKWAPRFTDVYRSVDLAPPGNDGWAVREGYTRYVPVSGAASRDSCPSHQSPRAMLTRRHSVTPLKASFQPATAHVQEGELQL